MSDFAPRRAFLRDDGFAHKFTQKDHVRVWCWKCQSRKAKNHGKLVETVTEAYEWWGNHAATQRHIDMTQTQSLVDRVAEMFTFDDAERNNP